MLADLWRKQASLGKGKGAGGADEGDLVDAEMEGSDAGEEEEDSAEED